MKLLKFNTKARVFDGKAYYGFTTGDTGSFPDDLAHAWEKKGLVTILEDQKNRKEEKIDPTVTIATDLSPESDAVRYVEEKEKAAAKNKKKEK